MYPPPVDENFLYLLNGLEFFHKSLAILKQYACFYPAAFKNFSLNACAENYPNKNSICQLSFTGQSTGENSPCTNIINAKLSKK